MRWYGRAVSRDAHPSFLALPVPQMLQDQYQSQHQIETDTLPAGCVIWHADTWICHMVYSSVDKTAIVQRKDWQTNVHKTHTMARTSYCSAEQTSPGTAPISCTGKLQGKALFKMKDKSRPFLKKQITLPPTRSWRGGWWGVTATPTFF